MKLSKLMKFNDEQKKLILVVFLGVVISGVLITVSPRTDIPPGDGFLGFGNTGATNIGVPIPLAGSQFSVLIENLFGVGDPVQETEFTDCEKELCKYIYKVDKYGKLTEASTSDPTSTIPTEREIDNAACTKIVNEMKNTNCEYIFFGDGRLNNLRKIDPSITTKEYVKAVVDKSRDIIFVDRSDLTVGHYYSSKKEATSELRRIVNERNKGNAFDGGSPVTNIMPFSFEDEITELGPVNIYDVLLDECIKPNIEVSSLLSQACYQRIVDVYGYAHAEEERRGDDIPNGWVPYTAQLMYCIDLDYRVVSTYGIDFYCGMAEKSEKEKMIENVIKVWGTGVDKFTLSRTMSNIIVTSWNDDKIVKELSTVKKSSEGYTFSEHFTNRVCNFGEGDYNPVTGISETTSAYHIGDNKYVLRFNNWFHPTYSQEIPKWGSSDKDEDGKPCVVDVLLLAAGGDSIEVVSSVDDISFKLSEPTILIWNDDFPLQDISVEEAERLKEIVVADTKPYVGVAEV